MSFRTNHRGTVVVAIATFLAGLCIAGVLPAAASTLEDESLLWAARTCYLEAAFEESDCIALLWVARKKAERVGRPWIEVLRRYSSIRVRTPRAAVVSEFPWSDIPGRSASFNRRWKALRDLVLEFAAGKYADPCPSAEHWGGSMDHPQGRMIPARCAVTTANTFYAIGAR